MTSVGDFALYVPYALSEALSYLAFCGTGYLGWRAVRAYEQRGTDAERLRALAARVQALEGTVEEVEGHVRQTVEAQRFTTLLLAERAARPERERRA